MTSAEVVPGNRVKIVRGGCETIYLSFTEVLVAADVLRDYAKSIMPPEPERTVTLNFTAVCDAIDKVREAIEAALKERP